MTDLATARREFWERCFEAYDGTAEEGAVIADECLAEWNKRWAPVELSRSCDNCRHPGIVGCSPCSVCCTPTDPHSKWEAKL